MDGLKVLKQDTMTIVKCGTNEDPVTNVIEHQDNLFVLRVSNNKSTVELCSSDGEVKETLFELPNINLKDDMGCLAVSDKYVVGAVSTSTQMSVYDFRTKTTITIDLDTKPLQLYFLPDGELFVVGQSGWDLFRYRIEDGQLTEVCMKNCCDYIATVCSGNDRLIYIYTSPFADPAYIEVLSPTGNKIDTFVGCSCACIEFIEVMLSFILVLKYLSFKSFWPV